MQISLLNDLELSTTVLSCSAASSVYSTSLIWAIPLGQSPDFGQTEDRVDLKKIWFLRLLDQWVAHLELVKINLSSENGKTAGHETPWNCLMTKVELYMLKVQMCINKSNVQLSFAPMNNKNRRFIHELAAMYGCSSISYDQEPNRNTVVTANKYVNFGKFVHFSLGNFALCVFIKNKVKNNAPRCTGARISYWIPCFSWRSRLNKTRARIRGIILFSSGNFHWLKNFIAKAFYRIEPQKPPHFYCVCVLVYVVQWKLTKRFSNLKLFNHISAICHPTAPNHGK